MNGNINTNLNKDDDNDKMSTGPTIHIPTKPIPEESNDIKW